MKFYVPMGYQEVPHNGNKPEDTLHTFVVYARKAGICRTFLVMAKDEAGAISNFLGNIVALGAELKKTLKPEDCEPRKIMAYNQAKLAQADEYAKGIAIMEEKLIELEDKEGDLAAVHRESLREDIKANYEAIAKLRTQEEVSLPSRFERMMQRVSELPSMTLTAVKLDPQRCYSVAYFDDPRDYTGCAD
jgi:hypothetical protein